jgi:hypothetical protein
MRRPERSARRHNRLLSTLVARYLPLVSKMTPATESPGLPTSRKHAEAEGKNDGNRPKKRPKGNGRRRRRNDGGGSAAVRTREKKKRGEDLVSKI